MNIRKFKQRIKECRHSLAIRQTVAFNDVDMMGVVWFGNYYRYFELARAAFCQKLQLDFEHVKTAGYELPVVRSECNYRSPAQYNDVIEIESYLVPPDRPMVVFMYAIRDLQERLLAFGTTEHVVCLNREPLITWDDAVRQWLPKELFEKN